jgi:hypothetical protein
MGGDGRGGERRGGGGRGRERGRGKEKGGGEGGRGVSPPKHKNQTPPMVVVVIRNIPSSKEKLANIGPILDQDKNICPILTSIGLILLLLGWYF